MSNLYNQFIQHALNELKGWPSPTCVDFDAYLAPGVLPTPLYGGRVVHVNPAGQFTPGATARDMPIFLLQGSADFDVANDGGPPSILGWQTIAPSGKMSGLVAAGSYELESTEFDQTKTYLPGDILKSPTMIEATAGPLGVAVAGMLFKDKSYATGGGALAIGVDNICGHVSRASGLSEYKVPILAFWPIYMPVSG